MSLSPKEIASIWKEQMQKGYLKLAILFVLTRGPLHGYQMIKRIKELTLGMITPTAGGLYPTLKELENNRLISGRWVPGKRKKVYEITERGREVFREAVERHFKLASSIRSWFFKSLSGLKIMKNLDIPSIGESAVRVLLLKENASINERIEALERLKDRLETLDSIISKMIEQITLRIEELRSVNKKRNTLC